MKHPVYIPGKTNLAKHDIWVVVIQTDTLSPTKESTEIIIKIFYSTYKMFNIEQVASVTSQVNSEKDNCYWSY